MALFLPLSQHSRVQCVASARPLEFKEAVFLPRRTILIAPKPGISNSSLGYIRLFCRQNS